jgi:hypothetical protein
MNTNQLYLDHQKFIKQQSWYYAKKYNIDFEIVEGKALELFCTACQTWKKNKSKFITYLYYKFQLLNNFCKSFKEKEIKYILFSEIIEELYYYEPSIKFELENAINTELSSDSALLVYSILQGRFTETVVYQGTGFRKKLIREKFGWSTKKIRKLFNEIKIWWKVYEENYIY